MLTPEIDVEYDNGKLTTTIDAKTYDICKYNQTKAKSLLTEEKFEIRSRLLGRVIEYIQMDILKEKLRPHMLPGFTIRKTDIIDDTMTGIDFVLVFRVIDEEKQKEMEKEKNIEKDKSKGKKEKEKEEYYIEKQCFIDTTTALNDETLFKKAEEAKKGKTPYNYFIERTKEKGRTEKEDQISTFPVAEKFVEESEKYTTPYLITKALECIEQGTSYTPYIQEFFSTQK